MITINTDKQLVRIDSWEQVLERPGFNDNLNPAQHELRAIIGRYVFKDKILCGLSSCHTPHNRGYLVVTKDGLETNLGKDCGRNHFGVDFNDMSRQFERDMTEKENRETLWSFHFKLDELFQAIEDLRRGDRGADWVHKKSRPLLELNKGCPQDVVRRVAELLKTGGNTIFTQRKATAKEIELEEERTGRRLPRPHYVDEPIGRVNYLDALRPENDLREILVLDLDAKGKEFAELNVDTMTHEQLVRWVKWVGTVEGKLERARDAIETGRHLLGEANLACLAEIIAKPADKDLCLDYLRSLA
ncbi:hypothetical protein [Cupriavidus sp. UYPR2.512]|uniref:hypothetical protein n=1 Tax=Cupriavidus sp. UYPR2.512 TaxID=1080187 RepID=UPI00037E36C4|nr:hypothetical protein [Cupriavidus sp. UYPR2.512]UIF85830.1 hypothetical protein KAF44_17495 [Cupriavidus necator]